MAPEIMRHNGEEEYTEKVDCFSFGMFIFELISLHLPFEGQECVKDHILDGGRPPLSPRDLVYPSFVLDLMSLCWSEAAKDRPAASQIVSIVSAPEFVHMLDCIELFPQVCKNFHDTSLIFTTHRDCCCVCFIDCCAQH